ncbi:TPA: NAD(+)/NADH kinase [Candidatus Avacholeplasma faecigallinarum]|nr:NAD(+)/NADH kinase [Candidatus Avacholeplasma faecigallinarum]
MIKNIKIFVNNNSKSNEIFNELKEKLILAGFTISEDAFDLGIAIGGDGAFLRMIKSSNFDGNCLYVGINTGTLGFAQEISADSIDEFICKLKKQEYKLESIGVQENKVVTRDNNLECFYSLNEIVIREKDLNTVVLNTYVDNVHLEEFVGDGLLIATSFGSTAYNLSFGGSIVFNDFHTLQITPIAPLNNKAYKSLLNSIIIPTKKRLKFVPREDKSNLLITVDGVNKVFDNVVCVETYVDDKRIRCLRSADYDFVKKVNDKFLR